MNILFHFNLFTFVSIYFGLRQLYFYDRFLDCQSKSFEQFKHFSSKRSYIFLYILYFIFFFIYSYIFIYIPQFIQCIKTAKYSK